MVRLISAGLLLLFMTNNAIASVEYSRPGQVTRLITYNSYGDGDVVFRISEPTASCYGYWLSPTDSGFKNSLAFILSARHTNTDVAVGGITT